MDCVDTAPTPARTNGQDAPTANALVATATAKAPEFGSCATMDQVMRGYSLVVAGYWMATGYPNRHSILVGRIMKTRHTFPEELIRGRKVAVERSHLLRRCF